MGPRDPQHPVLMLVRGSHHVAYLHPALSPLFHKAVLPKASSCTVRLMLFRAQFTCTLLTEAFPDPII